MRKQIFCLVCGLAFLGTAAVASAGELSVKIANGRATVIANARALYQERYSRPVYEAKMKRLLELVGMGEPAASGGCVSAVTRP